MLQLSYELTNRCDIACLHCLRDKDDLRKDLSREFVIRTLDEAKALGVQTISFTGGEPTLHPDYILLIDEVAKRGFKWITVTNGHNLDLWREVFASPIRRKALNLLAISVDGATEEVHDHIRGKGSFRKIMSSMAFLSTLDLNVRLQMTLTTTNYPHMEDFVSLASSVGAKAAFFGYLQATKKNIASGLMLPPEDYRRAQLTIGRLARMFKIDVGHTFGYWHPSPALKCTILNNNSMNVDYLGNMVFCCQLSNFGDVTYVPDREEIITDLHKDTLLNGYKLMLDKIADYNKTKADRMAAGEIKGLDLFPCFYCAKCFDKMGWMKDSDVADNPAVKAWSNPNFELPRALSEQEPGIMPSVFPDH